MPTSALSPVGDVTLRDEALDVLTGDVILDSTGDELMVYGSDAIASDLLSAWSEVKGEWYLDANEGVDWFGVVLAKPVDLSAINNEFTRAGLAVPGIVSLQFTAESVDRATRQLIASWQATYDTGQIVSQASAAITPGSQ